MTVPRGYVLVCLATADRQTYDRTQGLCSYLALSSVVYYGTHMNTKHKQNLLCFYTCFMYDDVIH